jgi:hypothetical protein
VSKDTTKNSGEKLSVTSTKTLTLKRGGVEQGVVRQSFSHGRAKAVVVEKVKRRIAPPPDPTPVLRALSKSEIDARQAALDKVEAEERRRVEDDRIDEQDARHQSLLEEFRSHHDQSAASLEANRRVEKASIERAEGLYLAELGALTQMPELKADLSSLRGLALAWTRVSSVEPLRPLVKLKYLNLGGTLISDLSPLTNLFDLEILVLWGTKIDNLAALQTLRNLRMLDLEGTRVRDFRPLSKLTRLTHLNLRGTTIDDLSSISNLGSLTSLNIANTKISDLTPVLRMPGLTIGAQATPLFGGLSFAGCPIDNVELRGIGRDPNPRRTTQSIALVRRISGEADHEVDAESQSESPDVEPIENIPSPFTFQLSVKGTIAVTASPGNFPFLPHKTSQRDHGKRLNACRTLADDLISDLSASTFNVRSDYKSSLQKYSTRLPTQDGDGNILLADAEARTLRSLFAAEAPILPPGFGSKLKTFLEHHIGLRVFYTEIASFYHDVQTGRIEAPLPLDAIDGVIEGVRNFTPEVFEKSVGEALETGTETLPTVQAIPAAEMPPADPNQPLPPRDPLGEVDAQKAKEFATAGVVNNLWKAFRAGEKVYKALDGWMKAGEALRPHVQSILHWLSHFSPHGGGPPMPPTISV